MFSYFKNWAFGFLIACFYWVLSRTWRLKEIAPAEHIPTGEAKIYAHWHGDELVLIAVSLFRRMAIMASTSKDGQVMRRTLQCLGFKVVQGSSTRGGVGGLKGLIDAIKKQGYHTSLAVDGPRGPIYEVKPGILTLAQLSGKPILVGVAAAEKKYVFKKAWNKCYLPLPFSKVVVLYGAPLVIPRRASAEELESLRLELTRRLHQLKAEAEAYFPKASTHNGA